MNILLVGASGGIGEALREQIASRQPDATIVTAARSGADHAVDLTREDSVSELAEQLKRSVGRLHWVINATGTLHGADWQPEKQLKDIRQQAMSAVLAVNAIGPLLLARHLVPLLTHDEPAVFASLAARVGSISDNRRGGWYSYRMSKAALVMGIRTLAIECARRAPRLTCVALHPGTVATALSEPFQRNVPAGQLFTPEQSASHLLDIIESLTPERSGSHLAWDGSEIPA
ncbi:MAG: SDR family NAD(P)-dependent oxidoreductase [Pseudomonadota bacterium]